MRQRLAGGRGRLRGAYTTHRYPSPNLQRADVAPGSLAGAGPAHAAGFTTSPASKLAPAFHTARVPAAILRATVTRANSGRSPRASNSPLRESPFWRVKLSYGRVEQLPRALSAREMRKLLSQARKKDAPAPADFDGVRETPSASLRVSSAEYISLRNLALVDLLFATGLRVGEVSALNVQDFFVKEAISRVKGKGGRNRLALVVDEEAVRIKRKYLEARARTETRSPALFLNSSGMRLTTQGIANVITRLREDAGIEQHVTPHMLRHTVATLLLRNGVDIRIVQEFLGLASIAMTQRYTLVTKEHL